MSSWKSVQETTPCFIINLDRSPDRMASSQERVQEAGFVNISRFSAVDAAHVDLTSHWKSHGSPHFGSDSDFTSHIGEQGCMLSHLNLWRHISDNRIHSAFVFEDDVLFHSLWDTLAGEYYDKTPKDFDILFMGSQIEHLSTQHVVQVPVYCTHAYMITNKGAKTLYEYVTTNIDGVRAIDCMLRDGMCMSDKPFTWYAWNGMMYPDNRRGINHHWKIRNTGLVYQDEKHGTLIKPRQ